MLFSSKPTVVIVVGRHGLVLYDKTASSPLPFGEELVQNIEVTDAAKLSGLVFDFANQKGLRGKKVLLLLDKQIVFQKVLTLNSSSKPADMLADFEDKIPFSPTDRHAVSVQQKDRLYIFGANKALYLAVADGLLRAGAKVTGVVPAAAYGLNEAQQLTPAKVHQVLGATHIAGVANFVGAQ